MDGELTSVVRDLYAAFDRKDVEAALRLYAADAQGIDELSRRWMRGRDELEEYMRQLVPVIESMTSRVGDVHEVVWGNVGVVTCWVEQDYVLKGKSQHVSSPTTVVLQREHDRWLVALIHTVPLPQEET